MHRNAVSAEIAIMGFVEMLAETASEGRFELRQPLPGLRHNQQPKIILHRFPVKNGLSWAQVLAFQMRKSNALLAMLLKNSGSTE